MSGWTGAPFASPGTHAGGTIAVTAEAGTPHKSSPQVVETVGRVLEDIRTNGDSAVRKYSEQFDKWTPVSYRLTEADVAKIVADLPTVPNASVTYNGKDLLEMSAEEIGARRKLGFIAARSAPNALIASGAAPAKKCAAPAGCIV